MRTKFYKYSFFLMVAFAAHELMAQTKDATVAFKDIYKSESIDNFTIREIKKKELEIVPSKIVTLNNISPADRKKSSKRKKGN